ncbi:MAG: cell surface protein SprA [Tannerella sp.]|jgi:cell surface protein SprA|nr:cell surface protein SprA [Tannerella sp.]
MRKGVKHIFVSIIFLSGTGSCLLKSSAAVCAGASAGYVYVLTVQDTIPETRYPVAKTKPEAYEDLNKKPPVDLRDPENLSTVIEYDIHTGMYIIRTRIGDMELGTPITLTPEEYQDYSMMESMRAYYREKNEENLRNGLNGKFDLTDMQFNIGPADKIFGPGGIRVKSQGSAELSIGLKTTKTKNPSLPERSRNRTFFNFDNTIQLNMQASVGTKINFNLNYNTQASFDFDASNLKLAYTGEEDEIIKKLEGGNVSLNTSNSLIRGGAALFGIKTELQFGKLRVNALLAQQNSESSTINTKGGAQTRNFEVAVDQYDEDRHFFLAHYFRDQYDKAMSKLSPTAPYASSGILIDRIEVWITNKRSNYNQSRNIVAFSDLGENEHTHVSDQFITYNHQNPSNNANSLYETTKNEYGSARDINTVSQTLDGFLDEGREYEKIASARRLEPSEYTVNKQLGYISLNAKLQPEEALAVAFNYTYLDGKAYQVGEFSDDKTENTMQCLFVKLLKGTTMSPSMPYWDLMMKNIYSLNAYSVQSDRFRLNILFQSDTTGTYINYIPEGNIANQPLIQAMNLDNWDFNNQPYPNGFFDFIEGYTIHSSNGRIIFPVVEPFGSHLRKAIGNNAIADRYVFEELYDSTKTVAQQIAEKNKFLLRGEYRASSGSEIVLNATNIARGSVVVTAGATTLTENVDYTVDYISGIVNIINQNIISSNTPIRVTMENQSMFSMQRKTMMGLDLNYEFSKNFTAGATIMHLSEMPLTTKTTVGEESIKNTLWGANVAYQGESQWLTNMVDKIPLLNLTQPSRINFNAEFAHLIAGHYESEYTGAHAYLDDFESTQSNFDLLHPYPWALASTPHGHFPEATKTNDIAYGNNRALMAWYHIDGLFTRKNSSLRPNHITVDDISDPYVRAVEYRELFPGKDNASNENSLLNVLNLAYYPNERGPYNLDADNINTDGSLKDPEKRWGGIMRKIDQTDFEQANIEYIEFWLMDPFIKNKETAAGGDLYFNLGNISEDILRDEKKFFENGLPINGDMSLVDTTVWGRVPNQQSTVTAFDNTTSDSRRLQDVGLNGLSTADEFMFPAYRDYLNKLEAKLPADIIANMKNDRYSPFNDPSGDNYDYFRGQHHDAAEAGILTRYKHYNGTEGNSQTSSGGYDVAAKMVPDVEDLNQDNTLSGGSEKYFEYKISLHPNEMEIGQNYIVNKREIKDLKLANGERTDVIWYQFKIPVKEYTNNIGSIQDFKSIRFMRLFMTGFKETTILRFGSFSLVRGEWRTYEQNLAGVNAVPSDGQLDVTSVNIEEDWDRKPINYLVPPGVSRMVDPSQSQIVQQNEQALSLKVTNLGSQDARAIYKTTLYDMRRYKRLQLFVHAESLVDNTTNLTDGELSVFLRLGSDYTKNYYEYEVPLKLTSPPSTGRYSDNSVNRELVWPDLNMLDFELETLTKLKTERNQKRRSGESGVTFNNLYSKTDGKNNRNKISIIGNPSLAEVKTVMIGIRNNSRDIKSGEVWVNEFRMTDFDENGGWAANGTLNIALSDLGTFNATGRVETAGFGGLDQSLNERNLDDYSQYAISASVQLGKFFPEKAHISLPLYYAYSKEVISPKYNPLDQDILLSEALDAVSTKAEKDSIKNFSQNQTTTKSFAMNNINIGIKSKNSMPYDPANFTFSYASSENKRSNPETEYETNKNQQASFSYNYTPYVKPFTPFQKLKKNNSYTKYIKQFTINYLPSNFTFQSSLLRNYFEMQTRDLNNINMGGINPIKPTFSEAFYFDRSFSIRWNPVNMLNIDFSSRTNARIETPHVQVNKQLEPDSFKIWKDAVMKSIRDLGSPLAYDQVLNVTYSLPFQHIPVLSWISSSATYNAMYNWERGSYIDQKIDYGNTITNQRQINFQGSMNFLALYNKNEFLKKVNQKFNANEISRRTNDATPKKKERPKFEKTIMLSPDTGVVVTHGLLAKKLIVRARRTSDSTNYKIDFKVIDYASIRISNLDSTEIKVIIQHAPPPDENFMYKVAEYSTRVLMMLRRVNIQYAVSDGMMLPGFQPTVGDWLGQASTPFGSAPGWGFALGDVRESYIIDAKNKNWLINNPEEGATPAMINTSKTFTATAVLEPVNGLKIDLNATRVDSRDTEVKHMYNLMPTTYGGTFTMSTVALGSMFSSIGNARNSYASKTFQNFVANKNIIAGRLEQKYAGKEYPAYGFMEGNNARGLYDPEKYGYVRANSADVLIPAFLAAYTGKDAKKIRLTAFPSLAQILPNWKISYDGLIQIPFIKKYFKSMVLNHQYRCVYNVSGYESHIDWVKVDGNDIGFIRNPDNGNPVPSSAYQISSVNITENLNPLIGIDATFLNNVITGGKYQKTRNLNLNVSSFQIIETHSNELVLTLGYKYADFNKILKIRKKGDFDHDLTLRLDYSRRKNQSLIRKIEEGNTQMTQGTIVQALQFSADYAFSKAVSLRAFYDLQLNDPLVSSASYPTSNSNYGVSMRISLAQ